jgi:hypothetical protein
LKAEILPYDDCDIEKLLNTLDPDFILRYSHDGQKYIQVVNFLKHQNPHKNEAKSTIPEMSSTSTVQVPEMHASNPADSLIPDSLIPPIVPQGGQKKSPKAEGKKKVCPPRYSESFLRGKAEYPSRGTAGQNYPAASENWEAWVGQEVDGHVLTDDDLIRACHNYHAAMKAADNIGKPFVLQMATFLSRSKPRFVEYLSDDFSVETVPANCETCANGQGFCRHIQRTPDPGEGPCEHYQEAR